MAPSHLFCFGLGYTGMALARQLTANGWRVSGTCREKTPAAEGVTFFTFSGSEDVSGHISAALSDATHILSTVPPSLEHHRDPVAQIIDSHLENMASASWIGYLSTTGVYGDTGGAEVNEAAPTAPTGPRGERRASAEQAWLSLYRSRGAPVHIFRLPGIYGPGRSVFDQVRNGKARRIHAPDHLFNRIHVDDIVQTLRVSMARPNSGAIYNICDDEPACPADVTTYASNMMGVAPPPLIPLREAQKTMSATALSFWRDKRRVSNRRIKDDLGVSLLYPSYREGLAAISRAEQG